MINFLIFIFVLFASEASAQITGQQVQSQLEAMGLSTYTNEQITLTASPQSLTSAKINDANVRFVTITAFGGPIRWTRTGQAPTSSYGNILLTNGVILLSQSEAVLFQAIKYDANSTTLALVEYYAPQGTPSIP